MPKIVTLVELDDGSNVPLDECSWLWVSPSGCALGITAASHYPEADAAHAAFEPIKRDRERQLSWGFTMRLITRAGFDDNVKTCISGTCAHTLAPLKLCKRCGRIGKESFHTVLDSHGKPRVQCAVKRECRKREVRQYGRHRDDE